MPKYPKSVTDRIERNVDRSGGPDACWPWTKGCTTAGYGVLGSGRNHSLYAHRVVYELTHGDLCPGHYVCHHCDNPPCCNPTHLFAGSGKDNMRDCMAKGRNSPPPRMLGEANVNATISDEQVRRIFSLRLSGMRYRDIAAEMGVHEGTVGRICRRGSRSYLPDAGTRGLRFPATGDESGSRLHPERIPRGEGHGNARFTADEVREMRAAFAGGERVPSICVRYGTSRTTIWRILKREAWAHIA